MLGCFLYLYASDDDVLVDGRWGGHVVTRVRKAVHDAVAHVHDAVVSEGVCRLARKRVEGEEPSIASAKENGCGCLRITGPVRDSTACRSTFFESVGPDLFARLRVKGDDGVVRSGDVHHAFDDDGRRLRRAAASAVADCSGGGCCGSVALHVIRPCALELIHVARVDLAQRGETCAGGIVAEHGPVRLCRQDRRRKSKQAEKKDARGR